MFGIFYMITEYQIKWVFLKTACLLMIKISYGENLYILYACNANGDK